MLCLLVASFVSASSDLFFSEEEDPTLYHHVNVISGHLQLSFQDLQIPGVFPFSLQRSYSSTGALEKTRQDTDLMMKGVADDFLVQGGWSFLAHIHLFFQPAEYEKNEVFFLEEKNGSFVSYRFSEKRGKTRIFKPENSSSQNLNNLNARMNSERNELHRLYNSDRVILYLADGGRRIYQFSGKWAKKGKPAHYRLIEEISCDQFETHYHYDKHHWLQKIELTSPRKRKVLASLRFEVVHRGGDHTPYQFLVHTSTGEKLEYKALLHEKRSYLHEVSGTQHPTEYSDYEPGRKGLGARLSKFSMAHKAQFRVSYYHPPSKKEDRKWYNHPEQKEFWIDKVRTIQAPLGPSSEWVDLATFSYSQHYTDVRDVEGVQTRYHHDGKRLVWIEHFDNNGHLLSSLKLFWEGSHLKGKAFCDPAGVPLYSKVFTYDASGNVIQETMFGSLTGKERPPFVLKEGGFIENAESYSRYYEYEEGTHLLLQEREDGGLSHFYTYHPGTSLISSHLTSDGIKICQREFSFYDEDHFLICEISDDGSSAHQNDLSSVTNRRIKKYVPHPSHGLPIEMAEYAFVDGSEKLLQRIEYLYSSQNRVIAETLYNAKNSYCYTLKTEYDKRGKISSKTTPSGYKNTYHYGEQGELLSCKEEGALYKEYTYNLANLPLSCTEKGELSYQKTTRFSYDSKGRLLATKDPYGNTTSQQYDLFGRCIQTTFPEVLSQEGRSYSPTVHFTYDLAGNLASVTTPEGQTSYTRYNAFRKPIHIISAEGRETRHFYSIANLLTQTIYPDKTLVEYTYDHQHRKTSETIFSPSNEVLSQERWVYDATHLLSHTNAQNLTTYYTYDPIGFLIRKDKEDRSTCYTYDVLGRQEKEIYGDTAYVTLYDPSGRILQTYTEDPHFGKENVTTFFYDKEGRKEKASRLTSQGEAIDLFSYDQEGRLACHRDPLLATTQFIHTHTRNALDQEVVQTITIDPLLCEIIETKDALGHLVSKEKKDRMGTTCSHELYFYDRCGNLARRVALVYGPSGEYLRESQVEWSYDSEGRLLSEKDPAGNCSFYTYNLRGQLETKTLPNKTTLFYDYDPLGRLTYLKSSDGTLSYAYHYCPGYIEPSQVDDLIRGTSICRVYNLFGELTQEISPFLHTTSFSYDDQGRCKGFILPDGSSISYVYTSHHLTSVIRYSSSFQKLYEHAYLAFDPNGHVSLEKPPFQIAPITSSRDLLERPFLQDSAQLHLSLLYDPAGLVIEEKNSLVGDAVYTYDALRQLKSKNKTTYSFDSLGNDAFASTNSSNEILRSQDTTFSYDLQGNPVEKTWQDGSITYSYDALNRLTGISTGETYIYDGLDRLIEKKTATSTTFYLYDHDSCIGTYSSDGTLLDLKVVGLGIQGDVGGAIAIELGGAPYIPLHTFSGHIIALLHPDGSLYESYHFEPFGQGITLKSNPWQFSSKRLDGDLIFFGKRFYDPSVGRFLTQDPLGHASSPNLYLYVLNDPINRLDLFGLFPNLIIGLPEPPPQARFQQGDSSVNIPLWRLPVLPNTRAAIPGKGNTGLIQDEYIVIFDAWQKLQCSPEEMRRGVVNIIDHLHELVPKEGALVGLVTFQNGMLNSFKEFSEHGDNIRDSIPEGTLFIGKYNPEEQQATRHFARVMCERMGMETAVVAHTRQFLVTIAEKLHSINPDLLWVHLSHSEGGMIAENAIQGMTPDQQATLKQHLYVASFGAAKPIAHTHTHQSINYYSSKDHITKKFGRDYLSHPDYNVQFLECKTPVRDRTLFFADHGFSGATYQDAKQAYLNQLRTSYQFYDPKLR